MNYSGLRQKDVINICDGRKMGKPIDLILNDRACAEALVVPARTSLLSCLKQDKEGSVIPWNRIRRIGDDVILVEFTTETDA